MLKVGAHTYSDGDIQVRGDMNNVTIGKYCSIGKNLIIDGGFQHKTDRISTYPFYNRFGVGTQNAFAKGDVIIGSDVWIGEDVTIMSGVTIGDGAVIGFGSVVTKDVRPYSIVGGSPAQELRLRFTEWQISALLKIRWWSWEFEKIINEFGLLTSNNIVEFIKKHGRDLDSN